MRWRGGRLGVLGEPGGGLLLLHGAGESAQVFQPLLGQLPSAFAIDLPGHGQTDGPGLREVEAYAHWVSELLTAQGWQPAAVGGHSMGGAISLAMALDGPYRPSRLVLIATGGRLRVHPELLAALGQGEFPERFRRAYLSAGASDQLLSEMGDPPVEVTHGDFLACDGFDVLERLGELRSTPALILVGDEDQYTPEKYARTLAREMGAGLEVLPGSGHLLPLEAPWAVASAIARFLAS